MNQEQEKWRDEVEAKVRAICAYHSAKESARSVFSAEENQSLLADEVDKLEYVIRHALQTARADLKREMMEKIEEYFYSLQYRIPLPDPITMRDEVKQIVEQL